MTTERLGKVSGAAEAPGQKPKSFYARLPGAFVYPFKRLGWAAILAGAVVFWVAGFLSSIPAFGLFAIFGIMLSFVVAGYLCAYIISIIGSSAAGHDAPPDWPDLTSFWDDVFKPLLLVVVTFVLSFLPLIVYAVLSKDSGARPLTLGVLLGLGLAYLPMGLIAAALYGSPAGLNPVVVVTAIVKTCPAYIVAIVLLAAACEVSYLMQTYVSRTVPVIGSLAAGAVSLYFLMVEMHILGLLYNAKARRLGWFE